MDQTSEAYTVDARGLACPEPVMLAKSGLIRAGAAPVEVLVDTATSRDNVLRLASREGRAASSRPEGPGFAVRIEPPKA